MYARAHTHTGGFLNKMRCAVAVAAAARVNVCDGGIEI